jgi:RHS repeat-associated protein
VVNSVSETSELDGATCRDERNRSALRHGRVGRITADSGTSQRVLAVALAFVAGAGSAHSQSMQSAHFSIPKLVENQGSGFRGGATYRLTGDVISDQPVDISSSANYALNGRPLVTVASTAPSCGVYINDDAPSTGSINVTLSLICGHPSGCTDVQLSNNGVSWSTAVASTGNGASEAAEANLAAGEDRVDWSAAPMVYTPTTTWTLPPNDGARKVFARFQNGLGLWSGPCWDSILLDTTAPSVSLSPTGGTYMSSQSIAVTASEPATVRYTSDGSDPTNSPTAVPYGSPVPLGSNATLRAFATDTVGHASPVASETYEICTGDNLGISGSVLDATRDSAPMPLVVVTLDNGLKATTTPSGTYSFSGLPRGWYTIVSVTSPVAGFVTYQTRLKLCQASVVHDIVLTKDATVYGKDTNSGYSADGVNTSTGNFAYRVSDLAIPGRGPSFTFERSYNSQDGGNGPLGYGWTWNYNISLAEDATAGVVVVRWGDGKTEVWEPDGAGGYTPMYGVFSRLTKNPDGSFVLWRKDLTQCRFDTAHRLAAILDEFGNTLSFGYSGANLVSILDTSGRTTTVSYDAANRITNVLDPIGRSVTFAYNVNGDLASATDLGGKTTRYAYDASHRLLTVLDPRGSTALTNTYDDTRDVVIRQRDAMGGETTYVYDVPGRTTSVTDAEGNTSRHHFDDLLRLVQEDDGRGNSSFRTYGTAGTVESATDRNGHVTTFTYDVNGNVLTKTEPLGRVTTATYDGSSNPLTRTDARGHTTLYEYDPANGNLVAQYACGAVPAASCTTDSTVAKTTYTYDPVSGQVRTVTEAAGHPTLQRTTTYQYDVFGNRVAVIDALGNTSAYTFDGAGRKLTETHPLGRATAYEYDTMDRLVTVTDALGGQSQFTYDANGNKTAHSDARLTSTTFAYDAKNRLANKTDALGGIEGYQYDALNRRAAVTNARGATSSIVYDAVGNVIQEVDGLGNVVRHEYDANGSRTANVDAAGNRTTLTYDALNRLVQTRDPLGNTQTFEYDANGNRTKVTDANGKVTLFTYDAFDRLATVTDPLGNTTSNAYDLLGRLVSVRDGRGNETAFEYDAVDRLVRVTDGAGGVVTATYDALGNRTALVDPRGKQTVYAYDVMNRLTSETDPLGDATVRAYDAIGNLLTQSNADGTTTYAYDALSRVTEISHPDLTTSTYTYDLRGNRTSVVDQAGTTATAYDLLDRISGVTDPFGNTIGYTYDPNANRNGITYPGNRRVTYLFDVLNRVTSVQDWGGFVTTYGYDKAGHLASQVMANGATVAYGYDDAGRLVAKEDRTAGGVVIASYTFALDPNGNRIGSGVVQPLPPKLEAMTRAFTHNDANQVVSATGGAYTYDGKGNRRTATVSGVTTQYTYDFNNRLTRASDGTNLWEYLYNSDGKRLSSKTNGVETRYLLDLNGSMEFALADLTAANAVKRYYVYGDGLLYSIDGTTGERLFYHYDPLGSTVALTNLSGAATDSYAYLPYGELAAIEGSHENPFKYVGKFGVASEGNGLYFMRARFYDPRTGAFLSHDSDGGEPRQTQSINEYAYVQNDPVALVDPEGLLGIDAAEMPLKTLWNTFLGQEISTTFGKRAAAILQGGRLVYQLATKGIAGAYGPGFSYVFGKVVTEAYGFAERTDVFKFSMTTTRTLSSRGDEASPAAAVALQVLITPATIQRSTQPTVTATQNRDAVPPPRQYLSVSGYARGQFGQEYRHILAPDFLDNETRSVVELSIEGEISSLQRNRVYGYRTAAGRRKAEERRASDVAAAMGQLYTQLTAALSKHEVLIRDLSALPSGATGGIVRGGVYAGGR